MLGKTIGAMKDKPEVIQNVVEIDVDEDPVAAAKYGIRGVPTLILVDDNGNELKRVSGALGTDKLLEFVNQ
jgi:thioredoxin-like negative regulator of GroEL